MIETKCRYLRKCNLEASNWLLQFYIKNRMEALSPNDHGNLLERQDTLEYIWRKNVIVNDIDIICMPILSGKSEKQVFPMYL